MAAVPIAPRPLGSCSLPAVLIEYALLMPEPGLIIGEGEVTEALPNTMFRVRLDQNAPDPIKEKTILCVLSGKMRRFRISVMPGDRAKVEVSPYDLNRGRISYRYK